MRTDDDAMRLPPLHLVDTIVSGGQTGVDQAALDVALAIGLAHGGWCPRGRRCELGRIPDRYRLRESHSARYSVRTEQNVIDSDGTLLLFRGALTGGSAFTRRMADKHQRPCLAIDLQQSREATSTVRRWLVEYQIRCLNVAGPRQSTAPGIFAQAQEFLEAVFRPSAGDIQ